MQRQGGTPRGRFVCAWTVAAAAVSTMVPARAEAPAQQAAARPADAKEARAPVPASLGFELPKVALPDLAGVRKARLDVAPPDRASRTRFQVLSALHAPRFDRLPDGACRSDASVGAFRIPQVPANVAGFETCVRLSADAVALGEVVTRILDPLGREVARAEGQVSFPAAGRPVDYVIEWVGFPARMSGRYHLEVRMGGEAVRRFPLLVRVTRE